MSQNEFRRLEPATGVATVDRNRVEVVARELDRGQRAIDVATNRRQTLRNLSSILRHGEVRNY